MTSYIAQSHVSFGDTWTAASHNILLDNVHALFTNVAANAVPFFSATDAVGAATLAAGKYLGMDASSDTPAALYPPGQSLPIGESLPTFSGYDAASLAYSESSVTDTAKPIIPKLSFSADTDSARIWVDELRNSPGTPTLKFGYYMDTGNTSQAVVMFAQVAAISDGDATITAKAFSTINSATISVPDTANVQDVASITLTNNDSMAKDDLINIIFGRTASSTDDTASGNVVVEWVRLLYGQSN